jgi:hypothetical protein
MQTRIWMFGASAVTLVTLAATLHLRPSSVQSEVAPPRSLGPGSAQIGRPLRTMTSLSDAPMAATDGPLASGTPPGSSTTTSSRRSPAVLARQATRERADAIRKQLDERRGRAQNATAVAAPPDAEAEKEAAQGRREFLQKAVREQYIPVAKSCYEELLARSPNASGKVVLYFSIVGDEDTGGVVDHVETREGTSFDDPEFLLCMRESMYSTLFDPPPNGGQTTVEYPLELSP